MSDLQAILRPCALSAAERGLEALAEAAAAPGPRRARSPLAEQLAPHVAKLPPETLARLRRARTGAAGASPERPSNWRDRAQRAGLTVNPPAAPGHLGLSLGALRCLEDTREAGDDDMWLGMVRVVLDLGEPVTHATDVEGPWSLGGFRQGQVRSFSPQLPLTRVSITGAPRAVTTVFVLAEVDLGGLGDVLEVLARGVNDELVVQLAQLAVTAVAPGSSLFSGLGPGAYGAASALAAELSAAVGIAMGVLVMSLLSLLQDEIFEPVPWTVAVPATPVPGFARDQNVVFLRRHARYQATLAWRPVT